MTTDVLVVGAGPTGLVLALWLARQGVGVRLVDRASGPGQTSRALAVQARTLELYRQLDLTAAVLGAGHRTPAVNLWVEGAPKARLDFARVGEGLTPYPFLHIFPQDAHERLLIERLGDFGLTVERGLQLTGYADVGDHVIARLKGPGGDEQTVEAGFICGCDGARSVVRTTAGASFPGGTYRQLFYVADIEAGGPAANGELHVDLDEADFLAVFPIDATGRARLIGTVRDERDERAGELEFADVSGRAIRNLAVEVRQVNWFSTYRVHHRVADRFRFGRAFLLGDAAHIHSPAGGQGMNTGIGDAINLAWKLAAVVRTEAPDHLLDSYESERRAFARRLVSRTDRAFSLATAEGGLADALRTRVAPLVLPRVLALEAIRSYLFRTVAQITLNYRPSPLSEGAAGKVRGGDRLPWIAAGASDNFASLREIAWQAHVYGAPTDETRSWCARRGLALHAFDWEPRHAEAGLGRDAIYLLRPDTYVGFAGAQSADGLEQYMVERGLRPAGAGG